MTAPGARAATMAAVPTLVALMQEFYAEAGFALAAAAAARTFEQLIASPQLGEVLVIDCDAEPVGFVVLTVCYSMEYGGLRGFVDDFYVRRPFRGRGCGAAGLAAVRAACAARAVRALLVETAVENAEAVSVYRRAGFTDSGHLLMTLPLLAPVHQVEE